jgi:hypothetical protein
MPSVCPDTASLDRAPTDAECAALFGAAHHLKNMF